MGVEFVEIAPSDKAVIEKWLGVAKMSEGEPLPSFSETHRAQRLIPSIPITVSGDLPAGVFSEETETQTVKHDGALFQFEREGFCSRSADEGGRELTGAGSVKEPPFRL
jgi:hypothetical protein